MNINQAIKKPIYFYKNYNFYRDDVAKNKYMFLEDMIIQNNYQIVSIILEKDNHNDYIKIFLPGFQRENQVSIKRGMIAYLFFICDNTMKQILLANKYIFEVYMLYYNEYIEMDF